MENKDTKGSNEGGILKAAATAIGGAAGKLAALTLVAKPAKATAKTAVGSKGRFPKTNKTRLPRRQKKQLAKKQGA